MKSPNFDLSLETYLNQACLLGRRKVVFPTPEAYDWYTVRP